MRFLLVLVLWLAQGCEPQAVRPPPAKPSFAPADPIELDGRAIYYRLSFKDAKQHYVDVELQVRAQGTSELEFYLPVWTPGSYLIREFSRHFEQMRAGTPDGTALEMSQKSKNRWLVQTQGREQIVVRYRVYCREMSVRTNFVDADLAIVNGAPTFLDVVDGAERARQVEIKLPANWPRVETSLAKTQVGETTFWRARDYHELIDSPILAGNLVTRDFEISGVPHSLVLVGELDAWDFKKSTADIERAARAVSSFWGQIPFARYLFMNAAVGRRGGLEHLSSTLIMSSAFVTQQKSSYHSWLGTVSHEYFHAWNVKRLRPLALGPFDYERENYTPSLWMAEGITSYYDDLLLRRAGVLDEKEYLAALSKSIQRLETTPGRRVQALSSASLNAWIKFYRPDENSQNTAISYYVKGAVVAFLLDAAIRKTSFGGKSLDDVMRLAYERFSGAKGFSPQDFYDTLAEVAGATAAALLKKYVETPEELDYQSALDFYGLEFGRTSLNASQRGPGSTSGVTEKSESPTQDQAWLGAVVSAGERLTITRVPRDTPAYSAGLNVDDELIAINNYRISQLERHLKNYRPQEEVTLTVSRRGRLRTLPITLGAKPSTDWSLAVRESSSETQNSQRRQWLGAPRAP